MPQLDDLDRRWIPAWAKPLVVLRENAELATAKLGERKDRRIGNLFGRGRTGVVVVETGAPPYEGFYDMLFVDTRTLDVVSAFRLPPAATWPHISPSGRSVIVPDGESALVYDVPDSLR